jgi:hypothetical protein
MATSTAAEAAPAALEYPVSQHTTAHRSGLILPEPVSVCVVGYAVLLLLEWLLSVALPMISTLADFGYVMLCERVVYLCCKWLFTGFLERLVEPPEGYAEAEVDLAMTAGAVSATARQTQRPRLSQQSGASLRIADLAAWRMSVLGIAFTLLWGLLGCMFVARVGLTAGTVCMGRTSSADSAERAACSCYLTHGYCCSPAREMRCSVSLPRLAANASFCSSTVTLVHTSVLSMLRYISLALGVLGLLLLYKYLERVCFVADEPGEPSSWQDVAFASNSGAKLLYKQLTGVMMQLTALVASDAFKLTAMLHAAMLAPGYRLRLLIVRGGSVSELLSCAGWPLTVCFGLLLFLTLSPYLGGSQPGHVAAQVVQQAGTCTAICSVLRLVLRAVATATASLQRCLQGLSGVLSALCHGVLQAAQCLWPWAAELACVLAVAIAASFCFVVPTWHDMVYTLLWIQAAVVLAAGTFLIILLRRDYKSPPRFTAHGEEPAASSAAVGGTSGTKLQSVKPTGTVPDAVASCAGHGADSSDCVVCFDAPRSVALKPCGHIALCGGCFASMQKQARHAESGGLPCCPVCRTVVKKHVDGLIWS